MELIVKREVKKITGTLGTMWADDASGQVRQVAFTLELPVKDGLPGSAIPLGRYQITLWNSPHFGRMMPILNGIPNRSDIEIHWGNTDHDTRGCILVGQTCDSDVMQIYQARQAFDALFPAIEQAVGAEGCWITIEDAVLQASNHDDVQEASV